MSTMEGLATGRMLVTAAISGNRLLPIPVSSVAIDRIRNRESTLRCDRFRISGRNCSVRSTLFVLCCSSGSGRKDHEEVDRLRRENSELRASLAELSQSLASISAAVAEVSRAVQRVANAVDCGAASSSANGVVVGFAAAEPLADASPDVAADEEPLTPLPSISSPQQPEIQGTRDPVQAKLMEQNTMAHILAFKIQQAFVQARIEGIGKPFQLAAEDFVTFCLEAHAMGIGLKELQLQLILLEGSLTGAFAMRNQRYSNDPVMSEESRVRSSWVRLVYTTLAEVKERRSRVEYVAGDVGKEREQPDPSDSFIKQLVTLAFEQGYDLERVKLEQNVSGPAQSGAIKTMRQSTYLVLLTLQKTTNDAL